MYIFLSLGFINIYRVRGFYNHDATLACSVRPQFPLASGDACWAYVRVGATPGTPHIAMRRPRLGQVTWTSLTARLRV